MGQTLTTIAHALQPDHQCRWPFQRIVWTPLPATVGHTGKLIYAKLKRSKGEARLTYEINH